MQVRFKEANKSLSAGRRPGCGAFSARPWPGLLFLALVLALVGRAQTSPAQEVESGRHKAQAAAVRLAEVLTPWEKSHLGLGASNAKNISLGQALPAYTISRTDMAQAKDGMLGGIFKETDLVFWPVRVAGHQRAGVWLKRSGQDWQAAGVGEKEMAKSMALAQEAILPALKERDIRDNYLIRLLVLDWAGCRFLAVLVRDRMLVWPLPSAAAMLNLKPGFFSFLEIKPMLSGRSLD